LQSPFSPLSSLFFPLLSSLFSPSLLLSYLYRAAPASHTRLTQACIHSLTLGRPPTSLALVVTYTSDCPGRQQYIQSRRAARAVAAFRQEDLLACCRRLRAFDSCLKHRKSKRGSIRRQSRPATPRHTTRVTLIPCPTFLTQTHTVYGQANRRQRGK
jgi:hypothetical protein